MPEPSSGDPPETPGCSPPLTVRLGPVRAWQGVGRGLMTPEELRVAGIELNAGRRSGWKKRLALLLKTPETTIAAWTSRSVGNARPIPGVVAVAVRLMVDLVRQAVAEGVSQAAAAQAVFQRVGGLGPDPMRIALQPGGPGLDKPMTEMPLPLSDQPILVEPVAVEPRQPLRGG